jgi:hypothetical protein
MGLPDLQLYDVTQEEAQDTLCITLIMKKFRKGFQYLFKKYSTSGYGVKPQSFDKTKKNSNNITITSLWSFRRDFLENLIDKHELS